MLVPWLLHIPVPLRPNTPARAQVVAKIVDVHNDGNRKMHMRSTTLLKHVLGCRRARGCCLRTRRVLFQECCFRNVLFQEGVQWGLGKAVLSCSICEMGSRGQIARSSLAHHHSATPTFHEMATEGEGAVHQPLHLRRSILHHHRVPRRSMLASLHDDTPPESNDDTPPETNDDKNDCPLKRTTTPSRNERRHPPDTNDDTLPKRTTTPS